MKKLITYISAILMICSNAFAASQLVCITDKEDITIAILTKNKNEKWCWGEKADEYSICEKSNSSTNITLIEDSMDSYIRIDVDRYTGSFTYFYNYQPTGEKYNWSGMCSPREKKY